MFTHLELRTESRSRRARRSSNGSKCKHKIVQRPRMPSSDQECHFIADLREALANSSAICATVMNSTMNCGTLQTTTQWIKWFDGMFSDLFFVFFSFFILETFHVSYIHISARLNEIRQFCRHIVFHSQEFLFWQMRTNQPKVHVETHLCRGFRCRICCCQFYTIKMTSILWA